MSQLYGLDTVIAIDNSQPFAVCINGAAGTGQTFLYNLILAYTRSANIAIGSHVGKTAFIPRIVMDSPKYVLPFQLRRRQLPLSPAFAMTINKAQGQTLQQVGLFMCTDVFAHGQLYVALSRIPDPNKLNICVLPPDGDRIELKNIVYRAIFTSY